jgi:hypothetical protein
LETENQDNVILQKLDQIIQLLSRRPAPSQAPAQTRPAAPARRSNGGGAKPPRVTNVRTEPHHVKNVFVDDYDWGRKFNIQTEAGIKIGTTNAIFGELATGFKGTGNALLITYGENARGYFEATNITQPDDSYDEQVGF